MKPPMATPPLTDIPYADFVADVSALAAQVAADDPWRPGFLVAIGRGGLVPGTYLSHATGLPLLSIDHSTRVPAFAADLLVELAARTRAGERLLFVDDINDSGRTIEGLNAALARAGAAADRVRFAVLIDNAGSPARVHYRARRIDRAVTPDWFVFPWEAMAPAATLTAEATAHPERSG